MREIGEVAAALTLRAEQDEAADVDRQYELERRGERAVAAMQDEGRQRARRWAEDDRRDVTDRRFDPEPEEPPPPATDPAPRPHVLRPPAPRPTAPRRTRPVEEEDDDPPASWLQ